MEASAKRCEAAWPTSEDAATVAVASPRAQEASARSLRLRPIEPAQLPTEFTQLNSRLAKRAFDVLVAIAGLVLLAPVMAIIAILVSISSPGPIIFNSPRVGRYGRVFMMPKFRTMRVGSNVAPREALSACDQQITPIGRVLRRSGLDELPQLFCVLSGHMSIIGPRPLLVDDPGSLERAKFPGALEVRPGISGLAQVSGRNLVPARRKARLDAFYARTASLQFDLILLLKTVGVIFSGKGFL